MGSPLRAHGTQEELVSGLEIPPKNRDKKTNLIT